MGAALVLGEDASVPFPRHSRREWARGAYIGDGDGWGLGLGVGGMMSGRCPVGVEGVLRASRFSVGGYVCFFGRVGRTGQNRTFPDIVGLGGLGGGLGFGHDGG